jgi:hypothetical protein
MMCLFLKNFWLLVCVMPLVLLQSGREGGRMKPTEIQPHIEIMGHILNSMLDGFGAFRSLAQRKITSAGIVTQTTANGDLMVDPNSWLSLRRVIGALEEIGREIGGDVLARCGKAVIGNAVFPPTINSAESCLESIQISYRMNHRSRGVSYLELDERSATQEIGDYSSQMLAPRRFRVVSRAVYPCQFDQGLLLGLVQKFERQARITHDDGSCRRRGGEACAYLISW